ncbi:hypothetical protein IV494_14530 [Kaistella sp. G5-32]|uniref:Lipoprotein n=1 Tax=Kaistella gelatinilytica TaxID=2787636 RepID=A0ABS0FFA1_9FLAO|nr:hypothetical protein [Kaistella gelatinilytica]MBF8458397.1 hypothetical protein [Kaistella gelatinilytica]
MQTNKKIIILTLFIFLGCKKTLSNPNSLELEKNANTQVTDSINENLENQQDFEGGSFVISCCSGCAMTYIARQAEKNSQSVKVKFSVDMYIDETLSESYDENYMFYYDSSNQLKNIKRVGEEEDFLSSQSINRQNSFKKFTDDFIDNAL